jgi:hypothetical protein
LRDFPISVVERSADEIVRSLRDFAEYSSLGATLRELSARHFWGDSKFLDGREEWLLRVLGKDLSGLFPRPLLLSTYAPKGFTQLLFIENQDTFVRAALLHPPKMALVYSAGFRATASRLGSATCFSFLAGSSPNEFLLQWQNPKLLAAFWGDLDFSGMAILSSLRAIFPHLVAWQPAYSLMLTQLISGEGHSPLQAGKALQRDPQETGCLYADEQLLPAIRLHNRFIDQESLDVAKLF